MMDDYEFKKMVGIKMSPELIKYMKIEAINKNTTSQDLVNHIMWDYFERTVPELIEAKAERIKKMEKEIEDKDKENKHGLLL